MALFGSQNPREISVRRPRWRRVLRWLVGALAVVLAGTLVNHFWKLRLAQQDLDKVIAQLDQDDPDWRLEAIEAKREVISDGENGALEVIKIAKTLPVNKGEGFFLPEGMDIPTNRRLPEKVAKKLADALAILEKQVLEARRLAKFSKGRFPISYSDDFISTLVNDHQSTRTVFYLLQRDAYLRAEEGNFGEALADCAACLAATQSLGDDPLIIAQLIRVAGRSITMDMVRRTLGQGELAPDLLAKFQFACDKELPVPILNYALRGERAGSIQTCMCLVQGKVTLGKMAGEKGGPSLYEQSNHFLAKPKFVESTTWMLQRMTEGLEIAKRPIHEQQEFFEKLDLQARDPKAPILGKLLLPAHAKIQGAFQRSEAQMQCVIGALALERYRLRHQRWPGKLQDLVPDFLAQVPNDPFDGKPIGFRQTLDGVVIYSIGPLGNLKGDFWDAPREVRANDAELYEFRLWDPDSRRLPPLPPAKDEDDLP